MRTAPALLVILALSLALTGCVPDDDPIVVDPEPSASPIFESDEEALAAAEEAYGAYLSISDQVLNDGGAHPERLLALVTEDLYSHLLSGFESVAEKGWHGTGATVFDTSSLQSYFNDALPGEQLITIYACVDLSNVDVLDASGASVVTPDRIDRSPYEVGFTTVDLGDPSLLVATEEPWGGENFCAG